MYQNYFEEVTRLIKLLKKKSPHRTHFLKDKRELALNSDHLYFLRSGVVLLEKEFQYKENSYSLVPPDRFLQLPLIHQSSTVLALEQSEIIAFNKNSLFDALEKEDILAHFIWYVVKDVYKILHTSLLPNYWSTRKKLLYLLKEITVLYPGKSSTSSMVSLPRWLKMKHLALLSCSSSQSVHYNLKKLESEKVIVFHSATKKVDLDKLTTIVNHYLHEM